jgi:predicted AAA+ superfamily ATPase
VGLELRRRCGGLWPEAKLWHVRTRRGAEVDYVLEVGRDLWAIEVKASRSVAARDARMIADFAERAPRVTRRIIVFLGKRRQQFDGAEALPLADFLAELPA